MLLYRLSLAHSLSMGKLTKKERRMTTYRHVKGSIEGECHRGKKGDVKEFNIEMTQLKERLSVLKELLQENTKDHNYGWKIKRRVKWPILTLFVRKLKHRINVWLKTMKT